MRGAAAIMLEVVFFALAFGWRSWIQWRRTGSTGFIRPRPDATPAELAGSGGFVLALVLLVAAPIAGMGRIDMLDTSWAAAAGVALGALGIVLTLVAQLAMGDSWRIGVDPAEHTALVTNGVFGRVRNPIFTAMLIATLGLVLLVPNLVSVAALVLLVVALEVQVRLVEEPYLHAKHGSAYDDYRATAGRFVPGIGAEPAAP